MIRSHRKLLCLLSFISLDTRIFNLSLYDPCVYVCYLSLHFPSMIAIHIYVSTSACLSFNLSDFFSLAVLDFRAKNTREIEKLRLKRLHWHTMRQAARVGQQGRFPTPGSLGAIRLRNRKYKLSGGWSERTCVSCSRGKTTNHLPSCRPSYTFSRCRSRASESKMAITSFFLPSTSCYTVKVKDPMSSRRLPLSVNML